MASGLDSLQAAILGAKLPHLDQWNSQRRQHAALYDKLLGEIEGVTVQLYIKARPISITFTAFASRATVMRFCMN